MKLLVLDNDEGVGVDVALRAQRAGHQVRYYIDPKAELCAKGMLQRVEEWQPSMEQAELIIVTGNAKYGSALAPYFGKGYPIFGANVAAAELELDREAGQRALEEAGVPVLPRYAASSLDDAAAYVARNPAAYAIKPWGGATNKALSCVCRDADEAIFTLARWKRNGLSGQVMLQEKMDGIEIGISGMFGPRGWCRMLEESFEHKKFMTDDLGCNTGEMGTVIKHVRKSLLFDKVLSPMTNTLAHLHYVGDCNINCIIDKHGDPWPLEFTMRLGWPDFCIRQAVMQGDPVAWMANLLLGVDSFSVSDDTVAGIVLTHGDFPTEKDPDAKWAGFPINGVDLGLDALHLQQVMEGNYITLKGEERGLLSAGTYLMVVTGTGDTVSEAAAAAYEVAWKVQIPSNLMFRTDIGRRLRRDLPRLHRMGYAKEVDY